MKKTYLTALSLMLATSAFVVAPSTSIAAEGQFYLAPGVQWIDFDKDRLQGTEHGFTLGLGYDFTDKISGEINVFDMDLDGRGPDKDLFQYRFDLLYSFDRKLGQLTPFFVAGAGHNDFSQNEETVYDAGLGVRYQLSENLEWRTAVRKFWGMDEHYHDYGIDTALVFRFGGSAAPATRPAASAPATRPAAAAPAAAPVASAPDADGDGVPDSRDACPDTPRTHRVDDRGCSIVLEEVARINLNVQFDFDQAVVKPEYVAEIRRVADFLNEHDDTVAVLEGHTDSMGTEEYNMALSQRRVDAVRQILINQFNIAPGKVTARGYGESRPTATNDTAQGRAQNRRVESVISTTLQRFQTR
ncbi:MAG: OmpA family protein [Gammaproteobacteria bacterium]|nr:OmpA family protein [Gammaproteobacteria bacterium]MDP2139449.1 OmpA family protein [Gammaproteobacteria bacterium]MDP2346285.1 OmpA family protein [Gammaproteobacteria bacterium]